jgi:hypothetical protein
VVVEKKAHKWSCLAAVDLGAGRKKFGIFAPQNLFIGEGWVACEIPDQYRDEIIRLAVNWGCETGVCSP